MATELDQITFTAHRENKKINESRAPKTISVTVKTKNSMSNNLQAYKGINMSKEAIELFILLTDSAELVHHTNVERHIIIDKIKSAPRELVNECNEKLREFRAELTTVNP